MAQELLRFFRALFHHWIPMLTGGVIMAGVGGIEHLIQRCVPWSYYAAVILVFIFYSCFAAWRDEFRARSDLEERARPKLSIHFSGKDQRPEVQDLQLKHPQDNQLQDQRLFRFSVRNDSMAPIKGAQVVLESVESEHQRSFFPGHGLRVMGRQDTSPHFDIGPGATQWVDLIGHAVFSSGEGYYLPYAEIGEREIPPGRHALVLRADGGGLPTRARFVVNCPKKGIFKVAEFSDVSAK